MKRKQQSNKIKNWFNQLINLFPFKTLFILLITQGVLVIIYRFLLYPLKLDVPSWFPISVLYKPRINITGIFSILLFIVIFLLLLWKIEKIKTSFVILGGFILIILGNLGQGGFENAFLKPFYETDWQYYSEAIKIHNWQEWLASFTNIQIRLNLHSQTHPPFAVLIHNVFINVSGNHLIAMSIIFGLISMLSLVLVFYILKTLGVSEKQSKLLTLFFAVIPAVNIYSIVCIDGIIMTTSTVFLLGIVILIKKPNQRIMGMGLMAFGFLLTNLLTFGGLFLIVVGFFLSVVEILLKKETYIFMGLVISLLVFGGIILILIYFFNYNHIQSFFIASRLQNPTGFRLISDPINYLLTRFEDIYEIAFFLSFSALSVILNYRLLKFSEKNRGQINNRIISLSGILSLILMIMTGAFCTGETARACLFIYPYLLILLTNVDSVLMKEMVFIAGFQTALMQICANYFW
jgi:hypothetical protein